MNSGDEWNRVWGIKGNTITHLPIEKRAEEISPNQRCFLPYFVFTLVEAPNKPNRLITAQKKGFMVNSNMM